MFSSINFEQCVCPGSLPRADFEPPFLSSRHFLRMSSLFFREFDRVLCRHVILLDRLGWESHHTEK